MKNLKSKKDKTLEIEIAKLKRYGVKYLGNSLCEVAGITIDLSATKTDAISIGYVIFTKTIGEVKDLQKLKNILNK
jgi:hypothetical protein